MTVAGRLLRSIAAAGLLMFASIAPISFAADAADVTAEASVWIPATDDGAVKRSGTWSVTSFRYAAAKHLATNHDSAALEVSFDGTGAAIRLGEHAVPAYGVPNLGKLAVTVDDGRPQTIRPRGTARELVLARGLKAGKHRLRVEHHSDDQGDDRASGCRIEGFWILKQPTGELAATISGEENAYLVDVRATLKHGATVVRRTLVRNWLTGQCQLCGLPPGDGYALELQAAGWITQTLNDIEIVSGRTTTLPPVFLSRDPATRISRFRFPALNRPAIRKPGQSFRARFLGFNSKIDEVEVRRTVGPAVISRKLKFDEDKAAAYYYDREVIAHLPEDLPPGLYDLRVTISGNRRRGVCRSPRSVHVVSSWPDDPIFFTFGHLDTSGQFQAEHLQRLAQIANLIKPELVLISTAVNPAYISGALSELQMPYIINFGNHQFYGHEKWYGDPVHLTDFGPNLCVLNFGHPWHVDRSKAEALLAARANTRCKIINAFESNAPVASFLDRHRIQMIHDGHGIGKKVADIGTTPTKRVGKVNANSFRIVRFQNNRVVKATYDGHATAPTPFARTDRIPLQVEFSAANDGTQPTLTALVTNRLNETYRGNVQFIMPKAGYATDNGQVTNAVNSDDGKYSIVNVAVELPAQRTISLTLSPIE